MSRLLTSLLLGLALASAGAPRLGFAQVTDDESHLTREGWYVDREGRTVSFDLAYEAWSSPDRHERQWARSLTWAGALLLIGTAWYWIEVDVNRVDWDFPAMEDRLSLEAMRFDNNRFTTNNLLHPLAGTGYYGLSRVNGLRVVESFLVAVLASAIWELAFEWREKVSINDSIFTPGAGVPLGENLFHLGEYLNSAPDGGGWPQQIARVTLGFPRFIHSQLDGPTDGPMPPVDDLGFSAAFWHRFHLAYELQTVENDEGDTGIVHAAILESELVSVPGYMRPGEIRLGFSNGNFTRTAARVGFDDRGFADVDLNVEATLAGYLVQSLEEDRSGVLHGHASMVGFDVGYSYEDRWLLGRRDQRATVHVAGPRSVVRFALGHAQLDLDARLHVDFSGVRTLAFDGWAREHGTGGVRSVVDERGYYYGLGWSSRLSAALRLEGGFFAAEAEYTYIDSLEGLDRHQERVTRDVSMDDRLLDYRLTVGLDPPTAPLSFQLGYHGLQRWSAMGEVEHHRWDRRWTASIGLRF